MVPNVKSFIQTLSTGLNTVYSYPNKIQQATDLVITAIDTSGVSHVFTYQTGVTFILASLGITATVSNIDVDTGSLVTLSAPISLNWILDLRTRIPNTQPTSIKNQGNFLPDLHEEAFDRATRQVQDVFRLCYLFGVHAPDIEVTPWTALPGPAGRANMLLGFDGNGMPIVTAGSGGGGGGGGGAPGVNATVITVSAPALQVPCDSSGNVTSFALAVGQANLYSGVVNLTPLAVWSIVQQVNCTAAITTNTGVYSFSALTQNVGTITINAAYLGQNYTIQVTISKNIPGATGTQGPPGTPGSPATPGLSIVLSNAAATVLAYANGGVPSFAGISGQAFLLSGGVDVSSSTTWSVTPSNLTGTINTAANTPVAGQPVGYYQVTAMTAPIGTLTIQGVFSGSTLTAVYTVTQVPTGYQIVSALPAVPGPQSFEGNVVYLNTDGQLYRFHSGAWVVSVPATAVTGQLTSAQIASITAAQLTGQITTSQIASNAITTPLLAAASVTAAQIAAGTIVAANIAAATITGTQIAASTIVSSNIAASAIVANNIAAGAVTAAKISVSSLSAISANIGTVTAGVVQNSGGSAQFDLNNSWIVFNNGVNMVVRGLGFGVASNYIEWFGPTQSSTSNFVACTDALAIYYLKTDGTYQFGATGPIIRTYLNGSGITQGLEIAPITGHVLIELWGGGASGAVRGGVGNVGGAGGGGYCSIKLACTKGDRLQYSTAAGLAGPVFVSTPLNGSNGAASTVTGTIAGGAVALTANGGNAGQTGALGTGGTASGGSTNVTGGSGTFAAPGVGGGPNGSPGGTNAGSGYLPYTPGGGGAADDTGSSGGSGAPGQAQFTYTP